MICPRPGSVEIETTCKADCPLAMGVTLDKESECSANTTWKGRLCYNGYRVRKEFVHVSSTTCLRYSRHSSDTKSLIGLMDEQVCFCILFGLKTGSELMLNVVKVLRLAEHQLSAVRVSGDNKDLYRRVAVDYQYGMRLDSNSLTYAL